MLVLVAVAASVFSKATTDGNAAALDKALEALRAYLEKAPEGAAARFAGSVSSNIVKKTCGARPSTAAKGTDCLLGLVEVEQAEKVMVRRVDTSPASTPAQAAGAAPRALRTARIRQLRRISMQQQQYFTDVQKCQTVSTACQPTCRVP